MEDGIVRSLPGIRFVSALPGGTYGLAFVGEHAARRKRVVVHILTAKWARPKDTVLQALHAHADVLKKLQIPNALPIVEVGCQNGQIFWVTDWAVGRPLPMPSGRVGVSAALAAARSVCGWADPHLPWLASALGLPYPLRPFVEPARHCQSFSAWFSRLSGFADAGVPEQQDLF